MTGPGVGPTFGMNTRQADRLDVIEEGRAMAEPENHTLHLLREMRDESRAFRKEMREGLDQARQDRQEMRGQLDSIQSAVGGLAYIQADQRRACLARNAGIRHKQASGSHGGAPGGTPAAPRGCALTVATCNHNRFGLHSS